MLTIRGVSAGDAFVNTSNRGAISRFASNLTKFTFKYLSNDYFRSHFTSLILVDLSYLSVMVVPARLKWKL